MSGYPYPDAWDGLNELRAFFGWRRAAELIGTCAMLTLRGRTAADVEEAGPSDVTEWRVLKDLRGFRKYLEAKGKGHLLGDNPVEGVVQLVRESPAA